MQYKVAPPVRGVDFLGDAQRAIPLVPDDVEDCCGRLLAETALSDREVARQYVTFLEALELVEETPRGYRRLRVDPDGERLADAFRRRVFGAADLLDALESGPLTAEEAFERLRGRVPQWERDRRTDWERDWRERTERLLDWSVALGLAVRDGDRYRPDGPDRAPD